MLFKRIFVMTILLLTPGISPMALTTVQSAEDEKFTKLVDEYLEFTWKTSPLFATYSGIHKYDDQIQSLSMEYARQDLEGHRSFLQRFQKEVDRSKLSQSNRIDYDLLFIGLRQQEFSLFRSRGLEQDPSIYPQIVAGLGFLMFTREYAPFPERMKNLASRMEKMPQILTHGKNNLKNPPRLWTNIAIQTASGAIQLYEQLIGPSARQFPEGDELRRRLEAATATLTDALRSYQEFLEKDLSPRSNGNFADGRENFVYRLKNFYMLDQSPEEIKAIAEKVLAETKEAMEADAKKLDPNKPWWEILEEAKKKHFAAEEVLPAYQKVTERSRQWVIDKKLASIPEEKLQVIETPVFMRYIVPYAAYNGPPPFETEQKGYYFVTPLDSTLPQEAKDGKLGELYIDIENTTVHEAYPGHHLQAIHQNRLSKVRRLNDTALMSEGWGLYCERLGQEFGFYSAPIDSLQAYRWLLIRAVRVIVDVGMHCEGMDYDSAVKLMVEETRIEKSAAEGEVRRYTQSPTQPLAYLMGMRMIQQLREEYKAAQGESFDLQKFHDAVMGYGSIPLKMIRESLL